MKILVLNSGSSSQKSALYEISGMLPEHPPRPAWQGKIEWDGDQADIEAQNSQGAKHEARVQVASRSNAIGQLLDTLWHGQVRAVSAPLEIDMVGHRIVHGGQEFEEATVVTPQVKSAIARMAVFAAAAVYPGPYEWLAQGIRRYGFHGINHQYCAQRAAQLLNRELDSLKLVTCHLGNGCSLAAIREGRSIDTTMGFTPLDGLMMGTRSGSLDPGILTYLMREERFSGKQLDDLLNTKSGLLGISGISGDMRQIVASMKEGNPRAKLAFDMFVHHLQSGIGAMIASLGGMDALVFTAGIGENSPELRAAACANFAFLGLKLNAAKNIPHSADQDISLPHSTVRVLLIRAQEDWAIARDCWRLASAKNTGRANPN